MLFHTIAWQQLFPVRISGAFRALGVAMGSARAVRDRRGLLCNNDVVSDSAEHGEREMPDVQDWHLPRLVIAWVVAAVIGVLVTVFVHGEERFSWLVLAIGVSTLVTFGLQLGTAQRVGFITRVAFSVAGSVLVIAVADLVGMLFARA